MVRQPCGDFEDTFLDAGAAGHRGVCADRGWSYKMMTSSIAPSDEGVSAIVPEKRRICNGSPDHRIRMTNQIFVVPHG